LMKKEKLLTCFGKFSPDSKCDKCERNFNCFTETMSGEICFANASFNEKTGFNCNSYCANTKFRKRCNSVYFISHKRNTVCEKFGFPKASSECVLCSSFNDCDITSIVCADLSNSFDEADKILSDQINSFSAFDGDKTFLDQDTDQDCYGKFIMDECWKGKCGFSVRCLRKSKIFPNGKCRFFPSIKEIQDKIVLADDCSDCSFKNTCKELLKDFIEKWEKEEFFKKIYEKRVSLSQMREVLEA